MWSSCESNEDTGRVPAPTCSEPNMGSRPLPSWYSDIMFIPMCSSPPCSNDAVTRRYSSRRPTTALPLIENARMLAP